jgi:cytosine/adenosine deaminase-related metal-dependent hydrolase
METIYSADWLLPIEGEPIKNGAVAFEDGCITRVGTSAELGTGRHFPGAAIFPGFVNAHAHLEYASFTGFGDGLDFGAWISLHHQRKLTLSFEEIVSLTRLGAAECLASGITTVMDASYSAASPQACADLGLKAIVGLEVFGADLGLALQHFEELRAVAEPALSDKVRLGISPHAPYTVSTEVYAAVRELGLPVMTHLAESVDERVWLTRGEGPLVAMGDQLMPPIGEAGVRALVRAQAIGSETVAAHCVDLEPEEIELLASLDVAVAHCPRSNGYLGCGIAPLTSLLAAGLRVGIGTDSPASTPSFDMFEELRSAVIFARARERNPQVLTAARALELATLGSARALGIADQVGSLLPGKRADIAIVALDKTSLLPWEDAQAAVVLGGSPERVVLTVVDGETKYEKGEFEWDVLRSASAAARGRMLAGGSRTKRALER